jgi:pentatricopeptide repeat domain-containing protein 1
MVGSSVGDGAIIDAVVAACEAGGDWTRGAALFTMWAANGVQGASDELRRAIAASSGLDPGPTRRGVNAYNAFRRELTAEFQVTGASREVKSTMLTAKVPPFVPRAKPPASLEGENPHAATTTLHEGGSPSEQST